MDKSKLELMLEDKFEMIDKDDTFFFISKGFENEEERDKVVIAVRDMESEIIITANAVKSLSLQEHDEIEFMLGYYPLDNMSLEDVLENKEKYEDAGLYVDLYENGYYEELDMINLSDQEVMSKINKYDFWQNANELIAEVLEVLSSVSGYYDYARRLLSGVNKDEINLACQDDLSFNGDLALLVKAINLGWESLNFSSDTVFAELKGPLGSIILETTGEVKIIDNEKEENYPNSEIFKNEEIMKEIKEGTIYTSSRHIVDNNNWFSMVFVNNDGNAIDDIVFESEPESIDEIIKELKRAYNHFSEFEEDVENSNYLVLVLKDFCFDGQITENDYCLHLVDSEYIDHCDYDKRDFNGEFVLGVYNTSSIDKALGLASLEYEMEEDMLKAYKLA